MSTLQSIGRAAEKGGYLFKEYVAKTIGYALLAWFVADSAHYIATFDNYHDGLTDGTPEYNAATGKQFADAPINLFTWEGWAGATTLGVIIRAFAGKKD